MTAEPLAMTTEAVALTEKKMDMTLDDIIMVSKKPLFKAKKPRVPSKKGGFSGLPRDNFRVQNFMESKSSLRQVRFEMRVTLPQCIGKWSVSRSRPRTLDSLFANIKEQRMHQQQMPSGNSQPRHAQRRLRQQWSRGRGGGGVRAANSRATNRYTR